MVATRNLVVDLLICRAAKHLSFAGSVQCTHGTEPITAEESTISTDPSGRKLRRNRIASYTLVSVRRVLESCDRCTFKMAMVASSYTGWEQPLGRPSFETCSLLREEGLRASGHTCSCMALWKRRLANNAGRRSAWGCTWESRLAEGCISAPVRICCLSLLSCH